MSTGLAQLPALLTEGHSIHELGLDEYEIATCEPLHDLKNLINLIFDEVHWQVNNKRLQKSLKQFCEEYKGMV